MSAHSLRFCKLNTCKYAHIFIHTFVHTFDMTLDKVNN